MDGDWLPQGYSATTGKTVHFLPLRPQEFLLLIWLTSEGHKA